MNNFTENGHIVTTTPTRKISSGFVLSPTNRLQSPGTCPHPTNISRSCLINVKLKLQRKHQVSQS